MAVAVAVPADAMGGRHSFGGDQLPAGPEAPDRGPAQDQMAETARPLRGTRRSVLLGGYVLTPPPRLLPGPLSSVPP